MAQLVERLLPMPVVCSSNFIAYCFIFLRYLFQMLSQDFIRENLFIAPLLQPWVLTSLKKFTYLKSSIKPTNHTQCDQFDKKTKISKTFCVNLRFTHLNCSDWPLNIFQPISVLQISITGSAHVHLFYQVSLIQSLIYN